MKFLIEQSESITPKKTGKDYFIEGIFAQTNIKNKNGRLYPKEIVLKEVARYNEEMISNHRSLGELGHPESPTVNLERTSHVISELKFIGDDVWGKAKILDTPYGKITKNLIDENIKLAVSTRGLGSLEKRGELFEVQKDLYFAAWDIVHDPSAPKAFVTGLMEGKEWIWENGVIKSVELESYKKKLNKTSRKEYEEVALKLFENFINGVKFSF